MYITEQQLTEETLLEISEIKILLNDYLVNKTNEELIFHLNLQKISK